MPIMLLESEDEKLKKFGYKHLQFWTYYPSLCWSFDFRGQVTISSQGLFVWACVNIWRRTYGLKWDIKFKTAQ